MRTTQEKWQTKEQFLQLVTELVRQQSISGSSGEVDIAHYIAQQLRSLSYFEQHPEYVQLHPTGDDRLNVTALVKKEGVARTAILIHHFDVVSIDDYGRWKAAAFSPDELTKQLYREAHLLPADAQRDIESGEWLFGRGTMDMKCGIAAHMAMIERATNGAFDGNVLFLSVCDEEVNSKGMITAVPVLLELANTHGLTYEACINSEPMFSRYPGDETKYIYTGSLGKVLPGFFCYGKESHAGEPFAGLNANMIVSYVTQELELNTDFCEAAGQEITPPPSNLQQHDLKEGYSVQTPHKAVALFNLFLMEKPMERVIEELLDVGRRAAAHVEALYATRAAAFAQLQQSEPHSFSVNVLTFQELFDYAVQKLGKEKMEQVQQEVLVARKAYEDERDIVTRFVDTVASLCNEKAPMILLYFAPPYYPAVGSQENPLIQRVKERIISYASEQGVTLQHQMYFGGISDLSYTGLQQPVSSLERLIGNMPLFQTVYSLPIDELQQLNVPVLNVGPVGKDAHKWTERLDVAYATGPFLRILHQTIKEVLS